MAAREDFTRLTGPYRRELIAHCYRMTFRDADIDALMRLLTSDAVLAPDLDLVPA